MNFHSVFQIMDYGKTEEFDAKHDKDSDKPFEQYVNMALHFAHLRHHVRKNKKKSLFSILVRET